MAAEPMGMAAQTTAYAGFWRRFAAYLIDSILFGIVVVPIVLVALPDPTQAQAAAPPPAFAVLAPLYYLVTWLYFALMESSGRQATLGKMALGIVVTDLDGNRIGFGKATARFFAKILSGLILYIGFIMAAFTQKKQGLHDMIAGTLVVKRAA
jgi:uncharacterized RDD family membrane protein YckC